MLLLNLVNKISAKKYEDCGFACEYRRSKVEPLRDVGAVHGIKDLCSG